MLDFTLKERYNLSDMIALIAFLRSDRGCPWDRTQTHESIRRNMVEEAYEAVEAIDQGDPIHLREELGDVLMQVLLHADMERTAGGFDIHQVADAACKKLVERHPHLFGSAAAENGEQALDNWDAVKRRQNGHKTHTDAMDSVARSLPALMRAEKMQDKAQKAGADSAPLPVVFQSLEQALQSAGQPEKEKSESVGNLLFAAVRLARRLGVDPELALQTASDRFLERFSRAEKSALERGETAEVAFHTEADKLWAISE